LGTRWPRCGSNCSGWAEGIGGDVWAHSQLMNKDDSAGVQQLLEVDLDNRRAKVFIAAKLAAGREWRRAVSKFLLLPTGCNLSDEELVVCWSENIVWRFFSGTTATSTACHVMPLRSDAFDTPWMRKVWSSKKANSYAGRPVATATPSRCAVRVSRIFGVFRRS